jgi:hypothetical protein
MLTPTQKERETLWWCIKRQVSVVGGWGNAIWCFWLIWESARELQREVKDMHRVQQAHEQMWDTIWERHR